MPSGASSVSGHHHHHVSGGHHNFEPGDGNDTISFGRGEDTIFEKGQASIQGLFGQATLSGGSVQVIHSSADAIASSGKATLLGGSFSHDFVSTAGKPLMQGGLSTGEDSSAGGVSSDTITGSSQSQHVLEFLSKDVGQHVITNFVAGHDKLYIDGHSFAQLQQSHEISSVGGNTIIKLDGGSTTIELKGVTDLGKFDITTHKPS